MAKPFLSYLFILLFSASKSLADEGMWLPYLLKQLNEGDMKKNGCRLSASDIYDINHSSLKDAVFQFGGGCTAEIISDRGLLLTNHHCGFSSVAAHSTVDKDYLTQGYWAMDQREELPNPGLTATRIVSMEDVTQKIRAEWKKDYSLTQQDSLFQMQSKALVEIATRGTNYSGFVRPFFYGNQYILFVTEVFKDVRLVGAPPSFIGKFGGDTDNWIWPRHTGDFSVFRIYANPENHSAEYSETNQPYKPIRSLTISLKGEKEGDFTLVYGFPGRTQEYLFSDAVSLLVNQSDPDKVALRNQRLEIMNRYMKSNDTTRIAYAATYASLANYWKKWMGEMNGLKKFDAVKKKKALERKFLELLSSEPTEKEKFISIFEEFHKLYDAQAIYQKQLDYYNECLMGINLFTSARTNEKILQSIYMAGASGTAKEAAKSIPLITRFFDNYNMAMDKSICIKMIEMYMKSVDSNLRVPIVDSLMQAVQTDAKALTDMLYSKSIFANKTKYLKALSEGNTVPFETDIAMRVWRGISAFYNQKVFPPAQQIEGQLEKLYQLYLSKLTVIYKDKKFYPDANSTLRVAYGKVQGYKPKDGVHFDYFTTLDGMMEKEDPDDDEFIIFPKMRDLYVKKDFGRYADKDGSIHVSFIASNHTTGGNSGSPVLNSRGELIGTNYDRVWEGTMSDVMFNPEICRNIVLDIRFTLFVMDKYAGAGYLLKEMKFAP